MKAVFKPSSLTRGDIKLPSSKSLAHRAIICASLSRGISRIDNIDYSIDVSATLNAMEILGAHIERGKDYVIIQGIASLKQKHELVIDCEESGSTLRFLIPICSLCGEKVTLTGKGRLMQRPQSVYEKLFEENGVPLVRNKDSIIVNGALAHGVYSVRGDVSSQFISGLLFVLPLFQSDSKLMIEGPFESRSYVELTIQMLKKFGIKVLMKDNVIEIFGNQHYESTDVCIEADYSQLAFFASLGVLSCPIAVHGLSFDSLQGDRRILSIVRQMNGKIVTANNTAEFLPSSLKAAEIDCSDCPDLGPALMMLASFAQGTTVIRNAGRLRIKESDRIEAMETELRKCSVAIHSNEDTVWIEGKTDWNISEQLFGHNDHRVVMALAIGIAASGKEAVIEGAEAVSKSYPAFFNDLKNLGVDVHVE